jgi:hypothetical protein
MLYCVEYTVSRGNQLEDAEWIAEELRSLPRQVGEVDGGYDHQRSRGWSLVPRLDQAVWWLRTYGEPSAARHLQATAHPVCGPEELPEDLAALASLIAELRYARQVLGAEPEDAFYLVHPDERRALAEDVALLLRYALCGRARLLPASRRTAWEGADAGYESRAVAAQVSVSGSLEIRTAQEAPDLGAVRELVDRLRPAPPRYLDLRCEPGGREHAERLAGLLAATGAGYPRIRES